MSIKRVRIDYDSPFSPGIFVIRCDAKGRITGENERLAVSQARHGAGHTDKVVEVVASNGKKYYPAR